MIAIRIKTDGKDILDNFEEHNPTLNEVALIIYRMEEIKKYLLEKEFESKFEVKEGSFVDEDE